MTGTDTTVLEQGAHLKQYAAVLSPEQGMDLIMWDMNTGNTIGMIEREELCSSSLRPQYQNLTMFQRQRDLHKEARIDKVAYKFFKDALPGTSVVAGAYYFDSWDKGHNKVIPNAAFRDVPGDVDYMDNVDRLLAQTFIQANKGTMLPTMDNKMRGHTVSLKPKVLEIKSYMDSVAGAIQPEYVERPFPWVKSDANPVTEYPTISGIDVFCPLLILKPLLETDLTDRYARLNLSNKFLWHVKEEVTWSVRGKWLDLGVITKHLGAQERIDEMKRLDAILEQNDFEMEMISGFDSDAESVDELSEHDLSDPEVIDLDTDTEEEEQDTLDSAGGSAD